MKSFLFLCLFGLSAMCTFGQSATLPAGGDATGADGSASFSIGQVVYQLPLAADGSTNQGVQQPYEISVVVGDDERTPLSAGVDAYPNPVQNEFVVFVDPVPENPLIYRVLSAGGKVVGTGQLTSSKTVIDSEKWTTGMYVIEIEHSATTIKILKTK